MTAEPAAVVEAPVVVVTGAFVGGGVVVVLYQCQISGQMSDVK